MDDLITDYTASGVKLTGLQHGLLYGTREVAIEEMSCKTIEDVRMTSGSGDGLSCSSDEVFEREWSEGLSLFSFNSSDNQKWEDRSIRNKITADKGWHIQCKEYICD